MPRTVPFLLFLCCIYFAPVGLEAAPPVPANEISRKVDEHFEQIWAANAVQPAKLADDATFLRRVYLDLTGTIPDVRQTREFLNDKRPDKRQRLIKKLLGTTEQSAHLARELAQAMLPNQQNLGPQFEEWLFARLQAGATWNQIAKDIIAPDVGGRTGEALFANSLERKPEKFADATARVFLGLQMGCAECHDHPFGQWSREEFWNYTAFFADVAAMQDRAVFGRADFAVEQVVRGPVSPLVIPNTSTVARPQFPGAKEIMPKGDKADRERLAEWMMAPDNPWFARAAVNRIWSMMFGRGLVEPVDDLTIADASLTKEVLELLAQDFAASGFDIKRLLNVIAATNVYQLASHTDEMGSVRADLFDVMSVRSLTANQIYGCLIQAVSGRRATPAEMQQAAAEQRAFIQSLTAPTQTPTEFQAGIPQMLTLLNGPLVARVTDVQKCDLLAALKDGPFFTDDDRIRILYLSTLTRMPTEVEYERAKTFLSDRREADSHGQELGDLLWVLLNSSEFLLNH